MAKEYFKELQEKIEKLEDGFDIKNIELGLLESEMQDILKPTTLLVKQGNLLLQMTEELLEYRKKHPGKRVDDSKDRLLTLLDINSQLSGICCYNQSLKLFNRELVIRIQLLRVENSELKQKLDNIAKADNF